MASTFDHEQSPRLGQRLPPDFPGVQKFSGQEIPEVAYDGMMIYREDRQVIQVFNDSVGAWEDAIGGIEGQYTYVRDTAPPSPDVGDLWWNTSVTPRTLSTWDGDSWENIDLGFVTPGDIEDLISGYVVEYAVGGSETVAPSTGWSTTTPTRTPGTYIWFRTIVTYRDGSTTSTSPALLTGNDGAQGEQGPQGPQGSQGIPGPPGADGQQLYTWLKYADSPTTGMSDSPVGKTYMGLAYNKTTATESSTYSDYTWSLIQGPQGNQGVQGPAGADGVTTYTWVKYAPNGTPTNAQISDSPVGMTHIGLAFNKTTATESTVATDYQWALIQGPQGPQGSQGIQGPPGTNGQSLYTWLKYADTPTTGMSDSPTGKTYMGIAYNKTSSTESSTYSDYEWSLIQGPQGNQGIQGPPGADGTTTYTWVKYGTSSAGAGMSDDPAGKTYIGLAYNKTTATESSDPDDYQWALIQGPQGTAGTNGTNGISVLSVVPYYAQVTTGAAAPAKPGNVATPPAPWVATEPAYVANTELYHTERVAYSDGSYAYTNVSKSSSYTAATQAVELANTKIRTFYEAKHASGLYPASNPTMTALDVGDLWYRTDEGNKLYRYNGTVWAPVVLAEDAVDFSPSAPPASSPGVAVTPTHTSFIVVAGNIEQSTVLDYYVDGVLHPDFTGTRKTTVQIDTTPAGEMFQFGVEHVFRVGARNGVLPNPALGPEITATLVPPYQELSAQDVLGKLNAAIAEFGSIIVGDITIDADGGITIPQSNSTTRATRFPADGTSSEFGGDAEVESLNVKGNLTIRGTTNRMEMGSSLEMVAGVSAPNSAPQATAYVPTLASHEGFNGRGLTYHANRDCWYHVESVMGAHIATLGSQFEFGFDSKEMPRSEITSGLGGMVMIGDMAYVLCQTTEGAPGTYSARYYVYKFSWDGWTSGVGSTWSYQGRWLYEPNNSLGAYSDTYPMIATDGTYIYIAQSAKLSRIHVTRYTTSGTGETLFPLDHDNGANWNWDRHVRGFVVGAADAGANRWWLTFNGNTTVHSVNPSTSRRVPAEDWTSVSTENSGMAWSDNRFFVKYKAQVAKFSKIKTGGSYSVTHTWRKTNGAAETSPSPATSVTLPARRWLRVETAADIPTDTGADGVRFYIGNALKFSPAAGVRKVEADEIPAGGEVAPSTFGFTSGTSRFHSEATDVSASDAAWLLEGNGSGRVGPLKWSNTGVGLYPRTRLTKNANQAITNNVATEITWNVEAAENGGDAWWSTGSLVTPGPGLYAITAGVYWAQAAAGTERASGLVCGGIKRFDVYDSSQNTVQARTNQHSLHWVGWLDGTQTVYVEVWHNLGSNLNVVSAGSGVADTMLEIVKIG